MKNKSIASNILTGIYQRAGSLFTTPYKKIGFNFFKAKLLKNLPAKKLQTVKVYNRDITFFSREEFLAGMDEIFIEEIYKQNLGSNPFIIDCGANIGLSVIYLKMQSPDACIIAFEPDEFNFKLLQKNITSFGFPDIELRQEAVWINNNELNFFSDRSLSSRIELDSNNGKSVKAVRLNEIMNRNIDFLKIDIEGAEYMVVKDIQDKLHLVKNIFIEYHGRFEQNEELNEILQIIATSGFTYYIKEAVNKHPSPFMRIATIDYDIQLNIFGFKRS